MCSSDLEEGCQAASDALMKTPPANLERRPIPCHEVHGRSRLFGLPKKVECIAGLVQRHVPLDYSVSRVLRRAEHGTSEHLKIDEALPQEVCSEESLSSAAASLRR